MVNIAVLGGAVLFCSEEQHNAYADNGTDDRTQVTDEGSGHKAFAAWRRDTHHKSGDDQTHTKRGTDVAQCRQLIFFEVTSEAVVIGQSQDRRVIGEISSKDTDDAGARKTVNRFHQRRQDLVHDRNHTELGEEGCDCACQNGDRHNVEAGVDQQVKCCIHHSIEHVDNAHLAADPAEEGDKQTDEDKALEADNLLHVRMNRTKITIFVIHNNPPKKQ